MLVPHEFGKTTWTEQLLVNQLQASPATKLSTSATGSDPYVSYRCVSAFECDELNLNLLVRDGYHLVVSGRFFGLRSLG